MFVLPAAIRRALKASDRDERQPRPASDPFEVPVRDQHCAGKPSYPEDLPAE
jgi:hypothetical protein